MTDQELKDLIGSLAKDTKDLKETQKRTTENINKVTKKLSKEVDKVSKEVDKVSRDLSKEVDKVSKEIDKVNKEMNSKLYNLNLNLDGIGKNLSKDVDKVSKEIDKVNKEMNSKLYNLNLNLDGIGKNNGAVAEEFFFNGLNNKMEIGKLKFETIDRNIYRRTKRIEDEFDVVMTNTDSITIFEIKYKYHPKDVEKVIKKIINYKLLFPVYKDYKFYGGIAGLSVPKDTVKEAIKYGFFVLTQSGNNLKVLNDNVFQVNP
jgi:hypothetical protein